METEKDSPGSNAVREDLVRTAVQFLVNPKVKDSSVEHKTTFLKKKGLTDLEISFAIQRALTAPSEPPVPNPVALPPQYMYGPPQIVVQQSFWSSWMNVTRAVFVIGGVTCSLYYLFDHYLVPIIFGKRDRLAKVESTLESMEKKLNETLQALGQVTHTLEKQQYELVKLTGEGKRSSNGDISKVEREIASLKAIMLGRKQFPILPSSSSGIPSWQVKSSNSSKAKSDDDVPSKDPSPVSNGTSSPELVEALEENISGDSAGEQIHSD